MGEKTALRTRELIQQLESLEQQQSSIRREARRSAEKRDEIHKKIKDWRSKADNLRERRNSINAKVKALKTQRDQTRALITEKIEETVELKDKLLLLKTKKPKRAAHVLTKEIEEIEWRIQTTSLTLKEERPLIKEVDRLRLQLNIHRQINDARDEITKLTHKIEVMKDEAEAFHKRLSELAQKGQELHSEMIKTTLKTKTLQREADHYHQLFLRTKQELRKIRKEFIEVKKKSQQLKKKLAETEKKEKMVLQEKARRNLKEKAEKKLKAGERLTFEEFKLLLDENADSQAD